MNVRSCSIRLGLLLIAFVAAACAEEKPKIIVPVVGQQMDDIQQSRTKSIQAIREEFPNISQTALDALESVPRVLFVADLARHRAYEDQMLPIGSEQVTLKLSDIAWLITNLQITPTDIVYEVGTGTGYMTALLARICKFVYTSEINEYLAENARQSLERLKVENYKLRQGKDGLKGWPLRAPFDVVIITAAVSEFPTEIITQLNPGARIGVPIVDSETRMHWRLYKLDEQGELVEYAKRITNIPRAIVTDESSEF